MTQQITSIIDYPSAYSNWLRQTLFQLNTNKELAICGDNAMNEIKELNAKYLPQIILGGTNKASNLPFLANRYQANKMLFYQCQNKSCQLPVTESRQLNADFLAP